jgi:hypothetical protein
MPTQPGSLLSSPPPPPPPPPPPHQRPKHRDALLAFCRTLNGLTALALILCGTSFGISIAVWAQIAHESLYSASGQAVRCFGCVLAVSLVLIECEWKVALRAAPLLDLWVGRCTAYAFVASLTYREAMPRSDETTDAHKSLALYRNAASVLLLVCAGVYGIGGVLCMGAIRRAREQREERLVAAVGEMEALEQRRRELQRLLGTPEEP